MRSNLLQLVLPRSKRFARVLVSRGRHGDSLPSMKLVNRFYTVLVPAKGRGWRGRARFSAIADRAMRRRLIDKGCLSLVPYVPVEELKASLVNLELAINIDRLLNELAAIHPRWCTAVEMKCFLGLTDQEVTDVPGMRLHTLEHMWHDARQWLCKRMEANATT
jgi:hypothetical protein